MAKEKANYRSLNPQISEKPNFFRLIEDGLLPIDAMCLSGPIWAAREAIQRPNYDGGGMQLYENDPLRPMLEELRKKGKIVVPDWCRHIPSVSRFGVSAIELERFIHPLFAQDADVLEEQVGNSYAAFLYWGNTAHTEWGATDTSEWFTKDRLINGKRLVGGNSYFGGLDFVDDADANRHYNNVGFSLRVVFPSK